jgi:acyl-CoA dehydrogenase
MPMDQPGIEIRPIVQITGGTEFNETFFSDAVCDEDMVVGGVGNGWKVAMGTLAFERGASTLGQQVSFRQEFEDLLALAKANGRWDDPVVRQELTEAHIRLEILKFNQLRMLTALAHDGVPGAEASIGKLYWAGWHRRMGELAMLVAGAEGMVAGADGHNGHGDGPDYPLDRLQRTFLYTRAHTIYGGSNQVQRNVLGERVLGLPREPRP